MQSGATSLMLAIKAGYEEVVLQLLTPHNARELLIELEDNVGSCHLRIMHFRKLDG